MSIVLWKSVAKVMLFFEKSKFFLILQGDGGLELRVLGLEFRGIADITHPLHSEPKTINSKKNYRGRSMAYLSARYRTTCGGKSLALGETPWERR